MGDRNERKPEKKKSEQENLGAKIVHNVVSGVVTGAKTVTSLGAKTVTILGGKQPQPVRKQRAKLLFSVVNRADEGNLKELLDEHSIALGLGLPGTGTAHSAVLDYFGIGETEKTVILSLIPENDEMALMRAIRHEFSRYRAGKGISFTVPLSGISEIVANGLTGAATEKTPDGGYLMKDEERKYDLIVAAVATGHADEAMEAARAAGAAGGTILRSRSVGNAKAEQFIGITLTYEQELLLILAKREGKAAIMQSLAEKVGLKTSAGGVIFSLPVDRTAGISAADEEAEERKFAKTQEPNE